MQIEYCWKQNLKTFRTCDGTKFGPDRFNSFDGYQIQTDKQTTTIIYSSGAR